MKRDETRQSLVLHKGQEVYLDYETTTIKDVDAAFTAAEAIFNFCRNVGGPREKTRGLFTKLHDVADEIMEKLQPSKPGMAPGALKEGEMYGRVTYDTFYGRMEYMGKLGEQNIFKRNGVLEQISDTEVRNEIGPEDEMQRYWRFSRRYD